MAISCCKIHLFQVLNSPLCLRIQYCSRGKSLFQESGNPLILSSYFCKKKKKSYIHPTYNDRVSLPLAKRWGHDWNLQRNTQSVVPWLASGACDGIFWAPHSSDSPASAVRLSDAQEAPPLFSFPWWTFPGSGRILECPFPQLLFHSLTQLSGKPCWDLNTPIHCLISAALWNGSTRLHDPFIYTSFMPANPVSHGWWCTSLLPA